MTQLALFDQPEPQRRRPTMAPGPTAPRYAKCNPKQRTLCDDCIRDIHALGQGVAPLPRVVRWRRTDPDGTTTLLCETHKEARKEQP